MEFVSGDRQQVDTELTDVERHFANCLDGIRVNRQPVAAGGFDHLPERLDDAGLVVRCHDTYISGFFADGGKPVEIDAAARIHTGRDHLPLAAFNKAEHRTVLNRGNHCRPLPCQQIERVQGRVHTLRSGACENDFVRLRADQFRQLLPRLINGLARDLRALIAPGGVSMVSREPWQHHLHHLWKQGGCRISIEIDHPASFPFPCGKTIRNRYCSRLDMLST